MIGQLIRNMLMIYGNYSFIILPITVGALGYVPKCIFKNIQNFGFTKNETKKLIKKLRRFQLKHCYSSLTSHFQVLTMRFFNE